VNPGPEIVVWILVGVAAGWLASRIVGTDGGRGALANVGIGVLGALVAGFVTRGALGMLGYDAGVAGTAGALFGSCLLVFGWHGFSSRKA
jgi:uncharacterized membrane protein YeaQ/YmgE (transglycosylase-associated protein family)